MRSRVEANLRYYNRTRRKVHAAHGYVTLCNQRGPIGKDVTCKTCLMVQRAQAVGKHLNEWDAKRLKELVRQQEVEKSRRWRAANPEKSKEASRRWREKNRDVQRVNNRLWAQENREKRREYMRQYWIKRKQENSSQTPLTSA